MKTVPSDSDSDPASPEATAPTWKNWSGNLVHEPARDGQAYYFTPTGRDELRAIVQRRPAGVGLRVTGQRHSQPPLVADDNRDDPPQTTTTWLIDMSCYVDLGPQGDQSMVLDASGDRVTVNAGVREDALDAFLAGHDRMLATVTAGGFFSVGGMTVVDVHGATIAQPIFAETACAFTLMGADGSVFTIDGRDPADDGWSPLQFARVSLGALGIVLSVTIDVQPRPHANTLAPGHDGYRLADRDAFVERYLALVEHDRLESFFNPYSHEFLALWWDRVDPEQPVPNAPPAVPSACTEASQGKWGAPYYGPIEERLAEDSEHFVQFHGLPFEARLLIGAGMHDIVKQVRRASKRHSDLWLQETAQVVFMSYFFELPTLDQAGLARAWEALDVVAARLRDPQGFLLAAPIEFRFVRGGDSALAGTYATRTESGAAAHFINLDLVAFAPPEPASQYPQPLLQFFADVERGWIALDGWPHNGKMYGFHDPAGPPGNATAPFCPGFLAHLGQRRGARLQAFERYRASVDPQGVFCNAYLRALGLGT